MLLSAGVPLPETIFIHGYITLGSAKVSKSLGNTIDPAELAGQYGPDALRYYLLREIKATEDGDFTPERFIRAYNTDLANQLGNLLSRFTGMINRYYDGVVPAPGPLEGIDRDLIKAAEALRRQVDTAITRFALHEALAAIWGLIAAANKYIVEVRPWELAKQQAIDESAETRLATVLYNLAEVLRLVAHYCAPFLPATAEAITAQLGIPLNQDDDWAEVSSWGNYPPGTALQANDVLFPKLELPV